MLCNLLVDERGLISFRTKKTREREAVKRFYLIAAGVIVAGALALNPPQRLTKPALMLKAPTPLARSTRSPHESVTVYVVGAVARSGVYRLRGGARILDAVSMAGGLSARADPAGVNLAELLADGQEIVVPLRGEAIERVPYRSGHPASRRKHSTLHRGAGRHRKMPLEHAIDINTADAAVLQSLPGVGAGLAQRLIDFRLVNGPFHAVDELADVAGMTDRRIEQITPYITLGTSLK